VSAMRGAPRLVVSRSLSTFEEDRVSDIRLDLSKSAKGQSPKLSQNIYLSGMCFWQEEKSPSLLCPIFTEIFPTPMRKYLSMGPRSGGVELVGSPLQN
jgi:hypothetical protein